MASEMVERVAKVINASGIDPGAEEWENLSTEWKLEYLKIAKAAIAAMKEPNEELMFILENEGYDAMIDKALEE